MNLTQIILNGISTGIGACFGTMSTFIVMRYFPKFWNGLEAIIKSGVKIATPEKSQIDKEK